MSLALFWAFACGIAKAEAAGESGLMAAMSLECLIAAISAIFMIVSNDRDVTSILHLFAVSVSLGGTIITWRINSRYFFSGIFVYGILILGTDIGCVLAIAKVNITDMSLGNTFIIPLLAILVFLVRGVYISVVVARTMRLTVDDKAAYDAAWRRVLAEDKSLESIHRIHECVCAWEMDDLESILPRGVRAARIEPPENVCRGREQSCLGASVEDSRETKRRGRDENQDQELQHQNSSFNASMHVPSDPSRRQGTRVLVPRQCNRQRLKHQSENGSIMASKLTPLSSIVVELMGGPGQPGVMDPRNPVTSIDQLYAQAQGIQWFFKHKLEVWVAALRRTSGGVSGHVGGAGLVCTRMRFSNCIKSPFR
jgi:hypothetical protein